MFTIKYLWLFVCMVFLSSFHQKIKSMFVFCGFIFKKNMFFDKVSLAVWLVVKKMAWKAKKNKWIEHIQRNTSNIFLRWVWVYIRGFFVYHVANFLSVRKIKRVFNFLSPNLSQSFRFSVTYCISCNCFFPAWILALFSALLRITAPSKLSTFKRSCCDWLRFCINWLYLARFFSWKSFTYCNSK